MIGINQAVLSGRPCAGQQIKRFLLLLNDRDQSLKYIMLQFWIVQYTHIAIGNLLISVPIIFTISVSYITGQT